MVKLKACVTVLSPSFRAVAQPLMLWAVLVPASTL